MNSLFSLYSLSSSSAPSSAPVKTDPELDTQIPAPTALAPAQSSSRPFTKVCRALGEIGSLPLDQFLTRSFGDRDLNPLDLYGRQSLVAESSDEEERMEVVIGGDGDGHADARLSSITEEDRDEEAEASLMVLVDDGADGADRDVKDMDTSPDGEDEMEVDGENEAKSAPTGILSTYDGSTLALTNPNMNPSVRMQGVARLHRTCQRAFGNSDALNFDFVEDNGPNSKQCVLTITRPNGSVRSYRTDPVYSKKGDAKVQVVSIAIERGALDFILNGDSDALKARKGELLAPLDTSHGSDNSRRKVEEQDTLDVNTAIAEIDKCCLEWRAGLVKPFWVSFSDTKLGTSWGAAMRIKLTPNCYRVYSTDTIHPSSTRARSSCAEQALAAGVLDFIKYGNGQTQPAIPSDTDTPIDDDDINGPRNIMQYTHRKKSMSLQEYYETLPQPFPGVDEDKTAQDINAPAWLNTALQSARGSKLQASFYYFLDSMFGLHGCLLRVDRPGEVKSYLVDCLFTKRGDAKSAACLLAMSSGVGEYIQQVKEETDSKMVFDRRKANEIVLWLHAECPKIREGLQPVFVFEKDRDAHGCTLEIDISSSPSTPDLRTFVAPVEFRSKADAKAAVACIAAEQGVVELVRFRGQTPPEGYIPYSVSKSLAWSGGTGAGQGTKRRKGEVDKVNDGNMGKGDENGEGDDGATREVGKRPSTKKQKQQGAQQKKQAENGDAPRKGKKGKSIGGDGPAGPAMDAALGGAIPTGPGGGRGGGQQHQQTRAPLKQKYGHGQPLQLQAQAQVFHVQNQQNVRLPPTGPRALKQLKPTPSNLPYLNSQYQQPFLHTQPPALAPHISPAALSAAMVAAAAAVAAHQPYTLPGYPPAGYPGYPPPAPQPQPQHQHHQHQLQVPQSPHFHEPYAPHSNSYAAQYLSMPPRFANSKAPNSNYPQNGTRAPGTRRSGGFPKLLLADPNPRDLEEGELGEEEDGPRYLNYGVGEDEEDEEEMIQSSRGSTPAPSPDPPPAMGTRPPYSATGLPPSTWALLGGGSRGRGVSLGASGGGGDGHGPGLGKASRASVSVEDVDDDVERLREIVRRKRRKTIADIPGLGHAGGQVGGLHASASMVSHSESGTGSDVNGHGNTAGTCFF